MVHKRGWGQNCLKSVNIVYGWPLTPLVYRFTVLAYPDRMLWHASMSSTWFTNVYLIRQSKSWKPNYLVILHFRWTCVPRTVLFKCPEHSGSWVTGHPKWFGLLLGTHMLCRRPSWDTLLSEWPDRDTITHNINFCIKSRFYAAKLTILGIFPQQT